MHMVNLVLSNADVEGNLFCLERAILLSEASGKRVYGMHESVSDSHLVS